MSIKALIDANVDLLQEHEKWGTGDIDFLC